jgi:hypothetical protein
MPPHQLAEGVVIALPRETLEQLPVGGVSGRRRSGQFADVTNDDTQRCARHASILLIPGDP